MCMKFWLDLTISRSWQLDVEDFISPILKDFLILVSKGYLLFCTYGYSGIVITKFEFISSTCNGVNFLESFFNIICPGELNIDYVSLEHCENSF